MILSAEMSANFRSRSVHFGCALAHFWTFERALWAPLNRAALTNALIIYLFHFLSFLKLFWLGPLSSAAFCMDKQASVKGGREKARCHGSFLVTKIEIRVRPWISPYFRPFFPCPRSYFCPCRGPELVNWYPCGIQISSFLSHLFCLFDR